MLIIGAKGFAKQIFDDIESASPIVFYDDQNTDIDYLWNHRILHNADQAIKYFQEVETSFCLGIGSPYLREQMSQRFSDYGGSLKTVLSKKSSISPMTKLIGLGSTILKGAIIEPDVEIGRCCLINVCSIIAHDSRLADYVEIAPGAHILGNVSIGKCTIVGAGAVILPNICIGENVIIGAGAVVTKNISSNSTVKGVPAK